MFAAVHSKKFRGFFEKPEVKTPNGTLVFFVGTRLKCGTHGPCHATPIRDMNMISDQMLTLMLQVLTEDREIKNAERNHSDVVGFWGRFFKALTS